MIHPPKVRQLLSRFFIFSSCICMFTSPVATADGLSLRYAKKSNDSHNGHHKSQRRGVNGTQHNNQQSDKNSAQHDYQRSDENSAQHNSHYAVGNVEVKQHSRSQHNPISHRQQQYYYNLYYSNPRYRSYTSSSQQYYSQQYTQPYRDSRFPNAYLNNSYYQQIQPLQYDNYNNNPVNYSVNAWEALAQGQVRVALKQFSSEARAYPKAAIPKIGYSLSAAASGDLKQGVLAMRRAFKIDPESLRHYQFDQGIRSMVNDLIGKYQYSLKHNGRHKDEAFMVAALSYLINDYTTAYHALQRAEHDGDRSRSWKNLRDFLEETQISTNQHNRYNY